MGQSRLKPGTSWIKVTCVTATPACSRCISTFFKVLGPTVARLQSFLFRLCDWYSIVKWTNHPTLPFRVQGLLYVPPDLILKTFQFAHTMYLRVPNDIIKGTVCRHRINRLVFLVEANYVLCEVLVKHLPIISIRLNFQNVPCLRL